MSETGRVNLAEVHPTGKGETSPVAWGRGVAAKSINIIFIFNLCFPVP